MADGTYERRGPREAELAKFKRLIAEVKAARENERKAHEDQKGDAE